MKAKVVWCRLVTRLEGSHVATKVHHLLERYLNTWLRIPLGEFYTFGNRAMFWLVHKLALGLYGWGWGTTQKLADAEAIKACAKHGTACKVTLQVCTTGAS